MSYRDATLPVQQRVADLRDEIDAVELRVAPFREELPPPLRRQLERLAGAAAGDAAPTDTSGWLELERALGAYRAALDEAARAADRLERRRYALPQGFPDRVEPGDDYYQPDVYDPHVAELRADVHRQLRELDPDVTAFDRAPRYFDSRERPYLVDATVRARATPLRLHLFAKPTIDTPPQFWHWYAALVALVPAAMPTLRACSRRWSDRLKRLLHLGEETRAADAELDRRYVLHGGDEAAGAILRDEVPAALLALPDAVDPALVIAGGVAVVEWQGRGDVLVQLERAIALLAALRSLRLDPAR